jgi:hypothetical protein
MLLRCRFAAALSYHHVTKDICSRKSAKHVLRLQYLSTVVANNTWLLAAVWQLACQGPSCRRSMVGCFGASTE